jgi:hypothetical protein
VRRATGELHHLEAARDLACRVAHQLAVFRGNELCQLIAVLLDDLFEFEQHTRTLERRQSCPGRKGRARCLHREADFPFTGERHPRGHHTERWIEHVARAPRRARHQSPVDPM